jgi:DNA adenine methylase
MAKRKREPDYNEAALNVVKIATGSESLRSPQAEPSERAKNEAAALLGRLGGLTILKNRTLHGGILAEGSRFIRNGERGKGISSRWYPRTLAKRMTNLSLVANRIEFQHGDGMDVLIAHADDKNAIFFIDPPYTAGGKRAGTRLYTHFELDHERLFRICKGLAGDFLMTYDNAEEVKKLARRHGFEMKPVAMKNTHHAQMTELLIGRNLDWLAESPRVYETASKYHVKRNSQHRKRRSAR